jgi:hypothetical protein
MRKANGSSVTLSPGFRVRRTGYNSLRRNVSQEPSLSERLISARIPAKVMGSEPFGMGQRTVVDAYLQRIPFQLDTPRHMGGHRPHRGIVVLIEIECRRRDCLPRRGGWDG